MFKIIILLIFIALNAFVYFKVRAILPENIFVKTIFNIFFIVIIGIFAASIFFRERLSLLTLARINNYEMTLLLAFFYLMLILLFVGLISITNKHFHYLPFALNTITAKRTVMLAALGFVALIIIWGRCNFDNIKIEKIDININKKANVETLKIVAASDLHLGYSIDKKNLKEIVALINSLNPDIILLAGDIVDSYSQPVIKQNMKEEFLQLQAPLGVYGVIGNHECYGDAENIVNYLKSAGIIMLQDSSVLLDNEIYIVGRDDKTIKSRKKLDELLQNIDKRKPVILLDHQPFNLELAQENGVDLQISGHTHGGQVFPFNLITKATYEKHHGYLKKENTHYYISSGAGGWGPKLRIGSQSEIIEITVNFTR
ncbi:MAG: metallophosphoesterase [Prevotellaceae bacterium]|nr:metallophosphoesterase [Prevotellaceae bacterium]